MSGLGKEYSTGAVLVIGGGITGITAAKNLSESGFRVYLVEKSQVLGGHVAQLDVSFPLCQDHGEELHECDCNCCLCNLTPQMVELSRDPNVTILTNSELVDLKGAPGFYIASILKKPRYVAPEKCVLLCGDCVEACPVDGIPGEFNCGLDSRKAIFLPYEWGVPASFAIDPNACLHFTGGSCNECEKACRAGAINLSETEETIEIEVGAIVVSTGFKELPPERLKAYKRMRDSSPNVLSGMQYERLVCPTGPTGGQVLRPSDGKPAKKIAFIQCVGSRNVKDECAVPYCSRICCMYATKNAVLTKKFSKEIECYIFNPEFRGYERGFQDYGNRAERDYGINFVPGRVGDVEMIPNSSSLRVTFEDMRKGIVGEIIADIVVLSSAAIPSDGTAEIARILNQELNESGWYPIDTIPAMEDRNIFISGCAITPMNIPESVASGLYASGKVKEKLKASTGTLVVQAKYIPEKHINTGGVPRTAVFICGCGSHMEKLVPIPDIMDYVRTLPNVVATDYMEFACSQAAQHRIRTVIEESVADRVLIAACSTRTHELFFQATVRQAGINPHLFEMVNIRDQDFRVHANEPDQASQLAKDLIRMYAAKVAQLKPQYQNQMEVLKSVLVIGGGLSGLLASLNIARLDMPVILIEKTDRLGGIWNTLTYDYDGTFSRDDINEILEEIQKEPRIRVLLNTQLKKFRGWVGNYEAILIKEDEEIIENVGGVVLATGVYQTGIPKELTSIAPDRIITQYELETGLDTGRLKLPENPTVVFHQCVGQRGDPTIEGALTGCGNVCCEKTLKLIQFVLELYPSAQIHVIHRGMQLTWKPSELVARELREKAIFQRYDHEKGISYESLGDKIKIRYHNFEIGEDIEIKADLAVLATPVKPGEDIQELAGIMKIPVVEGGYFKEAQVKYFPMDIQTDGIFLAGAAQYPKNTYFSRMTGVAAAGRAVKLLSKGYIPTKGIISEVDQSKCIGCLTCADVCPYSAIVPQEITINVGTNRYPKFMRVLKSFIVPASCRGCGTCVVSCPTKAISQRHFQNVQIIKMIEVFREQ